MRYRCVTRGPGYDWEANKAIREVAFRRRTEV